MMAMALKKGTKTGVKKGMKTGMKMGVKMKRAEKTGRGQRLENKL
jgi:hypothetical protein